MKVEEIRAFLRRERDAARDETASRARLADDALADRGDAILGLTVVSRARDEVRLRCERNVSRFRPGSRLELRSGASRWTGLVVDMTDEGRELLIRPDPRANTAGDGPWVAIEQEVDLEPLLAQCYAKLQPGAPGWSFFQLLAGKVSTASAKALTDAQQQTLASVLSKSGVTLDASQRAVLDRCLQRPPAFACQGPPGTGKSMVLAVVAECLARLGARVAVVALTHQATNNALSAVKVLFPSRKVIKVGDALRRESLHDDIECRILRDAVASAPPKFTNDVIVGMTFASALQQLALRSNGFAPNVLLVDEAGQIPLSQGALCGLTGVGSVLLFGDDAQMPPVFAAEVESEPLAVSVFRRLRAVRPDLIASLAITYRLNDELCRVVAERFYADFGVALRPSDEAASRRLDANVSDEVTDAVSRALRAPSSLVWYQTPNASCRQTNAQEAAFVAGAVVALHRAGMSPRQMAVVTPFRRQAAMIRRMLQSRLPAGSELPIVDTVERVQGITVDVVLVSATTSDPEFASSIGSFLFSSNRLNVAITRARLKAIVAISPSVFDAVPGAYVGYLEMRRYQALLEAPACEAIVDA